MLKTSNMKKLGEKYRKKFPERIERARLQKYARKIKLIEEIGGKCVCCNLTNWWVLTIDHIKPIITDQKETPFQIISRLLNNPEQRKHYQILCNGCNSSKFINKKCKIYHYL